MAHPPFSPLVLVVDDEVMIRCYATGILEDAGWRTIEAANSEEALAQLAAHPEVSVLFTDVNMPGDPDGLGLAHKVHAERPDVSIVVTSGRLQAADVQLPDNSRFLAKPYAEKALVKLIAPHDDPQAR
jgi:CheY-like chemotaxis protein